jgi:hypothetical protein
MYFPKILAAIGATTLFASTNAAVVPTSLNAGVIQARAMAALEVEANFVFITNKSRDLQVPASQITTTYYIFRHSLHWIRPCSRKPLIFAAYLKKAANL